MEHAIAAMARETMTVRDKPSFSCSDLSAAADVVTTIDKLYDIMISFDEYVNVTLSKLKLKIAIYYC